jgi:hypothetical protein
MGYLDKATITVDAILTNRGRELLAQGGLSNAGAGFNITKFAVADDEVDYSLYNTGQVSSALFGSVIENMPVLEATPDEQQIMRYKLVTLQQNVNAANQILIPTIAGTFNVLLSSAATSANQSRLFSITTDNINAVGATLSKESYVLLISDARFIDIYINNSATKANTTLNANGSFSVVIPVPTGAAAIPQQIRFERITGVTGEATGTIFGVESGATVSFNIKVEAS